MGYNKASERGRTSRTPERAKKMKYLNKHANELFNSKKVTYRGKVYWANMTTREVYAHSIDEEILGSISGYKVADIDDEGNIVKANEE